MLTPQEQERYTRQIMMPEIGETGNGLPYRRFV